MRRPPAHLVARAVADLRISTPECTEPIVAYAMDGPEVRCFTEPMLDEWFRSLSPERKAAIYERDLDGDPMELVMHDGMLRGTLADLVNRLKVADCSSARGSQERGVLLLGKPKLNTAAVEPHAVLEGVAIGPGAEGVATLSHLDHFLRIVEVPLQQRPVVLAENDAPLVEDHLEAHDDAVGELSLPTTPLLGRDRTPHLSHEGEGKAKISGNPVEVICG